MAVLKKQTFFQILFVVLIISLILFMAWMVSWLKGISSQCVDDPLGFYAERTNQVCNPDVFYYDIACVPVTKNIDISKVNFNLSSP